MAAERRADEDAVNLLGLDWGGEIPKDGVTCLFVQQIAGSI